MSENEHATTRTLNTASGSPGSSRTDADLHRRLGLWRLRSLQDYPAALSYVSLTAVAGLDHLTKYEILPVQRLKLPCDKCRHH